MQKTRTCAGAVALLLLATAGASAETLLERIAAGTDWTVRETSIAGGAETYADFEATFPGLRIGIARIEIAGQGDEGVDLVARDLVADGGTWRLSVPAVFLNAESLGPAGSGAPWSPCEADLLSLSAPETSLAVDGDQGAGGGTGALSLVVDGQDGCLVLAEAKDLAVSVPFLGGGSMGAAVLAAASLDYSFRIGAPGSLETRMVLQGISLSLAGTEILRIDAVAFDFAFDDGAETWYQDFRAAADTMTANTVFGHTWNAMLDDRSRVMVDVKGVTAVGNLLQMLAGTALLADGRQADLVIRAGQDAIAGSVGVAIAAPELLRFAFDLSLHMDTVAASATLEDIWDRMPLLLASLDVDLHDQGLSAVLLEEFGVDPLETLRTLAAKRLPDGAAGPVAKWLRAARDGPASFAAHPPEPVSLDVIAVLAMAGDFAALGERLGLSATPAANEGAEQSE